MQNKRNKALKPESDEIYFTLKVSASDFKRSTPKRIKLTMDIGPEFSNYSQTDGSYNPNFNAERVREILNILSDEVIKKVVAYVHYDEPYYQRHLDMKRVAEIEQSKKSEEQKRADKRDIILSGVEKYIKSRSIKPGSIEDKRESRVNQIRFERYNPDDVYFSVLTLANGDMPPSGWPS